MEDKKKSIYKSNLNTYEFCQGKASKELAVRTQRWRQVFKQFSQATSSRWTQQRHIAF